MFREIRATEKITDTNRKEERNEYREIKPETEMTYEKAKEFWDMMFTGEAQK